MSESRRTFLKTVTAASVASTLGNAAVLSKAYATQVSTRYGTVTTDNLPSNDNTLGIVGDIVTSKFYSVSATEVKYMANGYLTWALALAQQRLRIKSNQSAPSATVKNDFYNQVEACIADGVTDIVCMGGQSDLRNGTTLADLQTAWSSVIARAAQGAQRVWWLTQTPLNSNIASATLRNTITSLNTWIISKASEYSNVTVIDVTTPVSATKDGGPVWSGNLSSDGITPINIGALRIGQAIAAKWNAAISNHFELAVDPLDDIVSDPRSVNIVHNSLFTEGLGVSSFDTLTGGSGYSGNFDLVFRGGSGSGAIAQAVVSGGVVTGMNIINPGSYTSPPDVSFEKGNGSGAAGTIKLGAAGYANLNRRVDTSLEAHPDGNTYGQVAKVKVTFPTFDFDCGLRYAYTMNRDMLKHLGPKDDFSVRCEVHREAIADKLAAAGPAIRMYRGSTTFIYHSCYASPGDQALPADVQFKAVFLTPTARVANTNSVELLFHVASDRSYVADATGTVKVGRFSCLVQPSVTYTRAQKGIVNFHPGHYLNVYADWGYGHFDTQDGFETNPVPTSTSPGTTAAWRGIERPWYWKDLEPTKGVYNLDGIYNWLEYLRNYKNKDGTPVAKYLLVYLLSDSYNTKKAEDSFPQYILNDPEYDKGVYLHNNGKGYKTRYDNVHVQDRLIALAQAIAARFDSDPVFEGFRIDETAAGDTLQSVLTEHNTRTGENVTLTDYVEGQVRIAVEMNKAFKQSMFTIGFNYVADHKDTRMARMLVQAGVGMGAVDIVQIEPTLAGKYMSYDIIKSASRFVPSLAHFDALNYMSNGSVEQDVSTVTGFAATNLNASHISWYRQWPSNLSNNYEDLIKYFNAKKTQAEWQSAAGCTDGLNTVPAESIS